MGHTESSQRRIMQGNEAIAEGAIMAGAGFYAGYPITPSSEIAAICANRLLETGGIFLQMEDELASMAAIIGASLTGTKAFTATSGPGFSLMQENLGTAIMMEVPLVVIDVQRMGPSTSLATRPAQADLMQARWGRHGDQALIVLSPASVQECLEYTIEAFNLAERFRVPVIILADEIVGHMRETVVLPNSEEINIIERKRPSPADIGSEDTYRPFRPDEDEVPPLADFGGEHIFHVTSSMHGEDGYSRNDPANAEAKIHRLFSKLENHMDEIAIVKSHFPSDTPPEILIVTFGCTTRPARAAAMRFEAANAGVLQLITLWPFPEKALLEAAASARVILVPELNQGQLVREVRRVIGTEKSVIGLHRSNGEGFMPADIVDRLMEEDVKKQWL